MASIRANSAASVLDVLLRAGSVSGLSDEQLIELFVSGRDATAEYAFEALVQRHGPMVLGLCKSALGDLHDAEDAFQATFLVLARRADTLRAPARLGCWLHGVACRSARKVRARRSRFDRLARQAEAVAEVDAKVDTQEDIHRHEEAQVLHDEIGRLPERYRTPVVLCYLEGLTHAEAARRLGWSIGTVGVRLMRARQRLRAGLTRRGLATGTAALAPLVQQTEPLAPSLVMRTARAAVGFSLKSAGAAEAAGSPAVPIAVELLRSMATASAVRVLGAICLVGLFAAGSAAVAVSAQSPKSRAPEARPSSQKGNAETEEVKSILANGGFERGEQDGTSPEAWETGADLDGVEYHWDRTVAHSQRASLHLKKTARRYFPIAQWYQVVKRTGTTPSLKVSAFVKAKKMTKAILDVQFVKRDGAEQHQWAAYIGAKKATDPPVTHDWKKYEGVVKIPDETEKLIVAVQIYGPGDVWFDDVVAEYTDAEPTDPLGVAPSGRAR
jgi:RNA polymerase sigma-70 factor (ECF subfamily)